MLGVISDGQEKAVAARSVGWGAGGLGEKGTGAAGDLWRRWGCSRFCPKPGTGIGEVVTLGSFQLKIVCFPWKVDCEKPKF